MNQNKGKKRGIGDSGDKQSKKPSLVRWHLSRDQRRSGVSSVNKTEKKIPGGTARTRVTRSWNLPSMLHRIYGGQCGWKRVSLRKRSRRWGEPSKGRGGKQVLGGLIHCEDLAGMENEKDLSKGMTQNYFHKVRLSY